MRDIKWDRILSVWALPAAIVVIPFGFIGNLDALGWIALALATLAALVIHSTMRNEHALLD